MSTTRLPTAEEMAEAEQFFAGMGPFAFYVDPITDEFHAWIIVDDVPPVPRGAERRRAGGRRRPGARR